jgi:iron complex transport system substrate-binding protein
MKTLIVLLSLIFFTCSHKKGEEHNADRIVSLLPSLTETACALGLENRLVGISDHCTYPPEVVERIQRVGDCIHPSIETILNLKPGHVLLGDAQTEAERKLKGFGLKTVKFSQASLSEIYHAIREMGSIFSKREKADSLVNYIQQTLKSIEQENAHREKKQVLMVVGRNPGTLKNIFTVNKNGFLAELLDAAGGYSIFNDVEMTWAKVSVEEIIRRDPHYIIETAQMGNAGDAQGVWQRLGSITAVKNGRIFTLTEDYIFIPGPRVVLTAQKLSKVLAQ